MTTAKVSDRSAVDSQRSSKLAGTKLRRDEGASKEPRLEEALSAIRRTILAETIVAEDEQKKANARRRAVVLNRSAVSEEHRHIVEFFCKNSPEKAFELGVDVLNDVVETVTLMVERDTVALAEIEARGERIDRLNEENKRALAALVAS